jgi:glycosyltransferase involved in cell wall biosynthesis
MVMPHLKRDGPSRFALDLTRELRMSGVDAKLFVVRPAHDAGPHPVFSVPILWGAAAGARRRRWLPTMSVRLLRAARRADIVVAGNEIGEGLVAAYVAARLTRRKVGFVAQNNLGHVLAAFRDWHGRAAKLLYPRFDAVVAVSQGVRDTAAVAGIELDRVKVVSNGVVIEEIAARGAQAKPDWLPAGPYVVGVGRLEEQKGFDLLIRAHAMVLDRGTPHHVVLLGEGSCRRQLQALARELGVAATVLFAGEVANPHPVVAGAALFCMPSRFEGWPLALAEALVLEVPIVAADCVAGPSEILAGGRYGRLVGVEAVGELADAMERHLTAPEILRERARRVRDDLDRYSIRTSAEGYRRCFEATLSR